MKGVNEMILNKSEEEKGDIGIPRGDVCLGIRMQEALLGENGVAPTSDSGVVKLYRNECQGTLARHVIYTRAFDVITRRIWVQDGMTKQREESRIEREGCHLSLVQMGKS